MVTITIVELPRSHWRALPPHRLAVLATVAGIALAALAWGLLG